jgi:hypothetical protein
MGVYSVMIPDEKLLQAVAGFKRIVILGCTICANNSLAYDKDVPLNKILVDKETGRTRPSPVAIVEEVDRLKAVLGNRVEDISVQVGPGLCTMSSDSKPDEPEWVKHCRDAEAVVALCCAGGIGGVRTRLGKTVKIIPGMKTAGVNFTYTVHDHARGLVYIDKSRSQVMRIFE